MAESSLNHVFDGGRTNLFSSEDSNDGQFKIFFFGEVSERSVIKVEFLQKVGKNEFREDWLFVRNQALFLFFLVLEIFSFFFFFFRR